MEKEEATVALYSACRISLNLCQVSHHLYALLQPVNCLNCQQDIKSFQELTWRRHLKNVKLRDREMEDSTNLNGIEEEFNCEREGHKLNGFKWFLGIYCKFKSLLGIGSFSFILLLLLSD